MNERLRPERVSEIFADVFFSGWGFFPIYISVFFTSSDQGQERTGTDRLPGQQPTGPRIRPKGFWSGPVQKNGLVCLSSLDQQIHTPTELEEENFFFF